jgi:hypothetical protein
MHKIYLTLIFLVIYAMIRYLSMILEFSLSLHNFHVIIFVDLICNTMASLTLFVAY